VWAVAKLAVAPAPLVFAIADCVAAIAPEEFSPQSVANTAWSFAVLKVYDQTLFGSLKQLGLELASHFNAQNVSNTVWALAVVQVAD